MYCKNCGNQVDDKAVICTKCGCLTDLGEKLNITAEQPTTQNQPKANKDQNSLGLIAKIFMIVSTVLSGFYLIPLCWMLPMTISLSNKLKRGEKISTGFAICILIFCNTISGILLLCMKNND